MSQTKICPDCGTEYFAHIAKCADCGTILLLPEELVKLREERRQCSEKLLDNPVVIREGDPDWINELYHVLIDASVPCMVHVDLCNKGCSEPCKLMVSGPDAEKANDLIEEYFAKVHPEMQASRDLMREGKCPACGFSVKPDTVECPDCGLPLVIVEEEN